MGKFFKIVLFWVVGLLVLGLIGVIFFSPYTKQGDNNYRSVEYSINIAAVPDAVFSFMGNSNHAAKWSVYVDHITTLNAGDFGDGTVGSKRRCFCFSDETKRRWDEEILVVEKDQKRTLNIYNLQEFPMQADGLLTDQLYAKVDDNNTELTLSVYFENDNPGIWNWFKMKFAAYEIRRIFKGNLENIKRMIETQNG